MMKNLFRNITAILLVLVLLASTLQLSIYKMECLMSGNVQISLSDFEDCNPKQKPGNDCSITEICCCFHQMDLNFDFDSDLSVKTFIQIPSCTTITLTVLPQLNTTSQYFNFFTNLPPPSGFDLLKLVQVFRL